MKNITLVIFLSIIILSIPAVCLAGGQDDPDSETYTYHDALYLKVSVAFRFDTKKGEITSIDDEYINIKVDDKIQEIWLDRIDFIIFDSTNIETAKEREDISNILEDRFKDTNVALVYEEGGDDSLNQRVDSYDIDHHGSILYYDIIKYKRDDWLSFKNKAKGRIIEINGGSVILISDNRYKSFTVVNLPVTRWGINVYKLAEIESIEFDMGDKDIKTIPKERQELAGELEELADKHNITFIRKFIEKVHEHIVFFGVGSRLNMGLLLFLNDAFGETNYATYPWFNYGKVGANIAYLNGNSVYGYIGIGHIPIPEFQGDNGENFYLEIGVEFQKPLFLGLINDYVYPTVMASVDFNYMHLQATPSNEETSYIGLSLLGGFDLRMFNRLALFFQAVLFIHGVLPRFDYYYINIIPKFGIRFYL